MLSTVVLVWVALAVLAGIIELLSPTFGFVFVSAAALVAGCAAVLGLPLWGQVPLFAVVLVLSLLLLRPRFVGKLGARGVPTRTAALEGKTGKVTEAIDPVAGTGRVLVAGEDWAARAAAHIDAGRLVRVTGADGIVLHVEE